MRKSRYRYFSSLITRHFLGPPAGLRDVDGRGEAVALLVLLGERALELRQPAAPDEADGRAAKTPARHARAEHARDSPRGLGQEVELRTAHLKIVAQRLVRAPHQATHLFEVAAAQGVGGGERARVLAHDVAAAAAHRLGQTRGEP